MTQFLNNPFSSYMGPGLGGLWAGEQQKLAVDASQASTQKTLEDVLTQQQNREHATQKLPLELEKMREEIKGMPFDRAYKDSLTQEGRQRIDRNNYNDYLEDLMRFQRTGTPADAAGMAMLAQKRGLQPDHPMVQAAMQALNDPKAFKRLQDAVYSGGKEARAKELEHGHSKELENIRGRNQQALETLRGTNQKDLEKMRIDAGKYTKANTLRVTLETELLKARSATERYQKLLDASTVAMQLAQHADDPEEKARLLQDAQNYKQRAAVQYPQAQAELSAHPDPNRINVPGIANLPSNKPPQFPPNVPNLPPQIGEGPPMGGPAGGIAPGTEGMGGPAGPQPTGPGTVQQQKTINGVTYYLINGQWYK